LEQIQSKSDVRVVVVNFSGPFIRKVHSELETGVCLYKVVQCVTVLLLFLPDCLVLLKEVDSFTGYIFSQKQYTFKYKHCSTLRNVMPWPQSESANRFELETIILQKCYLPHKCITQVQRYYI